MKDRILITGAGGFLGRHLASLLTERGQDVVGWEGDYDLREPFNVNARMGFDKPTHVYHLAGYNGGLAFNEAQPARIFHDNTLMALNVLESCRKHGVKKVLSVVASCAYPAYERDVRCELRERQDMDEADFFDGSPHHTVACHAYAKRNLQLASQYYHLQHGLQAVCVCPPTLFGPGDSYDPVRTKVVGAMVKRFCDAKRSGSEEVVCWGTGKPLREVMYGPDCARLLELCMQKWDRSDVPLNLASGEEFPVKEIALSAAICAGYEGRILWDDTKPDGQFRKRLDPTRMREVLGELELTSFNLAMAKTVADYLSRFPVKEQA